MDFSFMSYQLPSFPSAAGNQRCFSSSPVVSMSEQYSTDSARLLFLLHILHHYRCPHCPRFFPKTRHKQRHLRLGATNYSGFGTCCIARHNKFPTTSACWSHSQPAATLYGESSISLIFNCFDSFFFEQLDTSQNCEKQDTSKDSKAPNIQQSWGIPAHHICRAQNRCVQTGADRSYRLTRLFLPVLKISKEFINPPPIFITPHITTNQTSSTEQVFAYSKPRTSPNDTWQPFLLRYTVALLRNGCVHDFRKTHSWILDSTLFGSSVFPSFSFLERLSQTIGTT